MSIKSTAINLGLCLGPVLCSIGFSAYSVGGTTVKSYLHYLLSSGTTISLPEEEVKEAFTLGTVMSKRRDKNLISTYTSNGRISLDRTLGSFWCLKSADGKHYI